VKFSLRIIFTLALLASFIHQMTLFYFPVYLKSIGFSGMQIGLLIGIYSIIGIIFLFPIGILNDAKDSRGLLIIAYCALAFIYFAFISTEMFAAIVLLYLLFGLARRLVVTSEEAFVFKTLPKSKADTLGKYKFFHAFGAACAFLISAIIISRFGFVSVLGLSSFLSVGLVLLSFWLPKTTCKFISLNQYKQGFLKKPVIVFAVIIFLSALHWGAEETSYSLFLKENLGLSWVAMGLYIAIPVFILAFCSLKVGKLIDKKPDFSNLLILGLALSGIGHILMTVQVIAVSFLFRIIHEIGDAILLVVMLYGIAVLFKSEEIGGLNALFGLFMKLGSFLAALSFGPIGEHFGYHIPILTSGIIILLVIPLVFYFKKTIANLNNSY